MKSNGNSVENKLEVFLHMAKDIEIKKQQKNMEAMDKF
jgi:hypothetical protein